ncbi:PLP-dependent transferase [Melanomma pulvis-pyrius CBS 109.77]|uniref:PLP-dependent transferase n=1 Tax=Melanomma pulvis-pyrius CBS 109.77 TaxID=1314802 RepID=A0A6A6XS84_9PLEO|nr:PLP-dependent transferase [Melanomma pulvis-pyrius CBS 109.77]
MTGHINLQLGWPSPSLFPSSQLLKGASNVLSSKPKSAASLVYGPDAGYAPLRESLAKWLTQIYAPHTSLKPDRICVTNGASGNLDNILARFTEPGYTRNIWMIEPSYFLACPIFMDAGFEGLMKGVPEDEEGLDVGFLRNSLEESEKNAQQQKPVLKTGSRYAKLYKHIIYCVPTFSNPSGKTMSLRRREELVRLAREFDALVVTDDVYDVLRWPEREDVDASQLGDVPPRIVDVDRTLDGGPKDIWGNSMSNGSFSKIIAPGMRVGWAEGTPAFTLALSQVGSTRSGGCPTQLSASFVHEMLDSGALEEYLRDSVIPTFRVRYYGMMRAIKKELLPLGFEVSVGKPYNASSQYTNGHTNGNAKSIPEAGGYFTYLTLPSDLSERTTKLATVALKKYDLKFAFGDMFRVQGDEGSSQRAAQGFGRGIRLSWAWHTEEEIVEGIQRLAKMIKDCRDLA